MIKIREMKYLGKQIPVTQYKAKNDLKGHMIEEYLSLKHTYSLSYPIYCARDSFNLLFSCLHLPPGPNKILLSTVQHHRRIIKRHRQKEWKFVLFYSPIFLYIHPNLYRRFLPQSKRQALQIGFFFTISDSNWKRKFLKRLVDHHRQQRNINFSRWRK